MIHFTPKWLLCQRRTTATGATRPENNYFTRPLNDVRTGIRVARREISVWLVEEWLRVARSRRPPLKEIVLWTTTSLHPSESQTSECSDLLSRSRAICLIMAQRQPGKLMSKSTAGLVQTRQTAGTGANRPENNVVSIWFRRKNL